MTLIYQLGSGYRTIYKNTTPRMRDKRFGICITLLVISIVMQNINDIYGVIRICFHFLEFIAIITMLWISMNNSNNIAKSLTVILRVISYDQNIEEGYN